MTPQAQATTEYYLRRQDAVESSARTYPRRLPVAIQTARGMYLTDVDGKRYLDCLACAGTLALGHNHPVVTAALTRHMAESLPMQTLDFPTPGRQAFVDELLASLPQSFGSRARVQFCGPTGSDAVEAALKLVKTATGRRSILAFHGAYHGQTQGALGLMGNLGPKAHISGLAAEVQFLPYPNAYRCPFGCVQCTANCSSAAYLEAMLDDVESGVTRPAAMILEVVQGEGGCIPAPDGWLREVRRITREKEIPLIVDEVQTGWGRTGAMYAFEHAGIEPDVLVLSKAIGGGLPLAVVLYDESLDGWQPGAHAGTFRGNQMAISAGLATLRYIQEHGIAAQAARMGQHLHQRLRALQSSFPEVGDVRGRGLMVGAEIVDPEKFDVRGRPVADGQRAREIQRACFDRGLILEVGGRHGSVLRFLPPLIVNEQEIDAIAGIVGEACTAARAGLTGDNV